MTAPLANIPRQTYEEPFPKGVLGYGAWGTPGSMLSDVHFTEVLSVEMIDGWWRIEFYNANHERLTAWHLGDATPLRITHQKDPNA